MNQINPRKLLHSKWTATHVVNKEKHFMVVEIEFDEEGNVIDCQLEAVYTHRNISIDWKQLKDSTQWKQGWK